jgi:hypothetical protein
MRRGSALLAACALLLLPCLYARAAAAGDDRSLDVAELVSRMSERIQSYYDRLTTVAFTESVLQEDLRPNLSVWGHPHRFDYEVIVTRQEPKKGQRLPQIRAERKLRSMDGKPVSKYYEQQCLDPEETYLDPLMFLLPPTRDGYGFTRRTGADGPLVLDFSENQMERTQVTWKDSHCFSADGGRSVGAIWLDPETADIVRLEKKLIKPFPILQTSGGNMFSGIVVIEQSELSITLRPVMFQEPDETLMLPESIVTVTAVRNAEPRRRRTTQTFSNFHRFMTSGRVRAPGS